MSEKPIKLEIVIEPRGGLAEWMVKRFVVSGLMVFLILAVPVGNHTYLGGGWALDLIGGVLGFLVACSIISVNSRRRRTFQTVAAAAAWVTSEEWRDSVQ